MTEHIFREIHFPKLPEEITEELREYFIELERRLRDVLVPVEVSLKQGIVGDLDHGELAGLSDDDHTQYLKEEASGGSASETPDHTHANTANCGTVDHGALTGKGDDDHTRYVDKDGSRAYTGTGNGFKDEDNMASDLALATASQQSIKAYVDALKVYVDARVSFDGNIISNHDFATGDFTGWTAGGDWSVVDNKAKYDGYSGGTSARLYQTFAKAVRGRIFTLKFTLSGVSWQDTDGKLTVDIGGAGAGFFLNPGNGTHSVTIYSRGEPPTSDVYFIVVPSSGAGIGNNDVLYIDDVSVREVKCVWAD